MRNAARFWPHVALFVFALTVLGGGCGGGADRSTTFAPDAGAAARDASPRSDAGPTEPPRDEDAAPDLADASVTGGDSAPEPMIPDAGAFGPSVTCGDLMPNEPGGQDCLDVETCGAMPICCADRERDGCCSAPRAARPRLDFGECLARGSACLDELDTFGSPSPAAAVLGGGLALWLGGSPSVEGGVLDPTPLDPGGSLVARVGLAVLPGCATRGTCAETMAAGFTTAADAASATERALAAVISLDTAQLLLVDGNEVVARQPLSLPPGSAELVVRLAADGRLRAEVPGGASIETVLARPPTSAVHVVLFGRGGNGTDNHLLVQSLDVQARACDRPAAATIGDSPIELRQTGGGAAAGVRIEQLAVFDTASGRRQAVLVDRGVLRSALEEDDGSWSLDTSPDGVLGAALDRSFELAGVLPGAASDEMLLVLVLDGQDVVGYRGDGTRFDASTASPITSASALSVPTIAEPAIVRYGDGVVLAFGSSDEGGRPAILTASGSEGALALDDDAVAASEHPAAFDRDGVRQPALVVSRGLLQLFYVGRRGVADSIGLARRTSNDTPWIRYAGGPVLSPGGAAWRALGVTRPTAVLAPVGDGTAQLDLYFVGSDGLAPSLGLARRILPE